MLHLEFDKIEGHAHGGICHSCLPEVKSPERARISPMASNLDAFPASADRSRRHPAGLDLAPGERDGGEGVNTL
jgi:hypothetical protein